VENTIEERWRERTAEPRKWVEREGRERGNKGQSRLQLHVFSYRQEKEIERGEREMGEHCV
jgi:hypothetical protein